MAGACRYDNSAASANADSIFERVKLSTSSLSQAERKLRKRAMLGPHSIVTNYYYYYYYYCY